MTLGNFLPIAARQRELRAKVNRVEALLTEAYGGRVWRAENYSDDVLGALVAHGALAEHQRPELWARICVFEERIPRRVG